MRAAALALLAFLCLATDASARRPHAHRPRAHSSHKPAPASKAVEPATPSTTTSAGVLAPRREAVGASYGGGRETVQRESHIEFDDRLVQGQTAAGAIYLFQRGESEFRSMIKLPESFRERTVRQLLPPQK